MPSVLDQINELIKPLNHIVYEFVVLILLYIAIKKTQNITIKSRYRWSFLYLFAMFAIAVDWFMWMDMKKTLLFTFIVLIYIYYNMQNEATISQFLDIVDIAKDDTNQLSISAGLAQQEQYKIMMNKSNIETQLNNLTYNPPDTNPYYMQRVESVDTSNYTVNPIDGAFETILPPSNLPNDYTNAALGVLYNSPQYHNILKNDIDQYLDNNIHNNVHNNVHNNISTTQQQYSQQQQQQQWDNYALLKNPKREFFDSNWIHIKTPYYNDHCYSNGEENDFVKFGYKLENCTNKQNILLDSTMTEISGNQVQPILHDFTGNIH